MNIEQDYDLPAKFESRLNRRDKKRKTKMIIDGQGIKRVAQALQDRRWSPTDE